MENDVYELLIMTGGLFVSLILVVFIICRYSYLTRKITLERLGEDFIKRKPISLIELGIIIVCFGTGLGISSLFTIMNLPEDTMLLLIYATILIFGGIGLMLAHQIRKRL